MRLKKTNPKERRTDAEISELANRLEIALFACVHRAKLGAIDEDRLMSELLRKLVESEGREPPADESTQPQPSPEDELNELLEGDGDDDCCCDEDHDHQSIDCEMSPEVDDDGVPEDSDDDVPEDSDDEDPEDSDDEDPEDD